MNNNNSYLNIIKTFVNINDGNKSIYQSGFPVYATSKIYPDCILKFIDSKTAKLIKRSEAKEYNEFSSGIFGKPGDINYDYASIDAYYKGSNYWIPVPEIRIKKEVKRNIAFYKESGLPWTKEEYINCIRYSGEPLLYNDIQVTFDNLHEKIIVNHYNEYKKYKKYIYDDKSNDSSFMHWWQYNFDDLGFDIRLSKLDILIYEEIFCNCKNIIWID